MTSTDFTTIFAETIADRDWVAERANCRIRAAFQVLAARVRRDVRQFEQLDAEHHAGGVIELSQNHAQQISVLRDRSGVPTVDRPYVVFDLNPDHIEINAGSRGTYQVTPKWDPGSRRVKFQVGDADELLTASRLSERFLLRLFFPDLTNHDT